MVEALDRIRDVHMTVIVEVRGVQAFGNGASDALDRAATHDRRCESSRTRLLRLHASGIVDLFLGRYASGIESFRAAVTLAEELQAAKLKPVEEGKKSLA